MKKDKDHGKIHVPALQASMGTWTYYSSTMRLRDIADRVRDASELYDDSDMENYLQRKLTDRSKEISHYLLNQPQRFFNALVVGVYGGHPDWRELKLRPYASDDEAVIEESAGVFGILTIQQDTRLWAIDGQHRVSGIQQALLSNPSIGDDRLAVLFVSGVAGKERAKDEEGYQRTRRLFTVLNKHAKSVSPKDVIALDEDDIAAIVTRRMVSDYIPLKNKINFIDNQTSIPKTDSDNFTIITAIYDALSLYLKGNMKDKNWRELKKNRPDEEMIDLYYRRSELLFNSLIKNFRELDGALSDKGEKPMSKYRNQLGGHLIFRPLGLLLVVRSVVELMSQLSAGRNEFFEHLELAVSKVSAAPMNLASPPWKNLIWDSAESKMIVESRRKNLAYYMLIYLSGGSLTGLRSKNKLDVSLLKKEYGNILGIESSDVDAIFGSQ